MRLQKMISVCFAAMLLIAENNKIQFNDLTKKNEYVRNH